MRKSLNELQQIEHYLFCQLSEQQQQDFQLRLLLEASLQEEVHYQQKAYDLVRAYGRQQLRAELHALHEQISSTPDKRQLWQSIRHLFNRKK